MRRLRAACNILVILALGNACYLTRALPKAAERVVVFLVLLALFLFLLWRPQRSAAPTARIRALSDGSELLRLFLITVTVHFAVLTPLLIWSCTRPAQGRVSQETVFWAANLLVAAVSEFILFWSGMLRVCLTSVQLGVRHRVLAALCGWVPVLNIRYLRKIIRITADEAEFETEKWELDETRAESELCRTKYPILLVHGVFFRDYRYVNYWGRIPRELLRNGATIYYGRQQSAASVEESGRELAERIRDIAGRTGKVNIIAHSKGGLDARAAIAHCGCGPYVASLTTVNTPHRGCLFAEYLLHRTPRAARLKIARTYNAALRHLGDRNPDFLSAVTDLTESACLDRNGDTPDDPGVLYESVGSFCARARSGRFPLNVSYPLVKHFDGKNDGLVSVESARWGSRFTLLAPSGGRGISHGDMIDLNRENLPGFDVREFYVKLAAGLKERGF